MKKSLIALAVLAASGAAMAQSSVTLYGIADVWLGSVAVESAGTKTRTTEIVSGGVSSSRWGMRGSEDLGGGLKANFQLEQGVTLDTGAAANFGRQSHVGLSGDFGAVKVGLTGTAYADAQNATVALFDSDLSPVNGFTTAQGTTAAGTTNAGAVFRSTRQNTFVGNMIHYQAPNFSGFSGAVSHSLAESSTTGLSSTSLNLTYAGGPFGAQIAYEKVDNKATTFDAKFFRLGASYNFGVATAKFQYGRTDNITGDFAVTALDGAKTTEYAIGADIPVSAALTLSVAYAKSDDNAFMGDQKRDGYGIAAAYALSKRTTLYGGYKAMTYDNVTAADIDASALAVGVRHAF